MLFELTFIIDLAKSPFQNVRNWFNKYNFSSWNTDVILPTEHRMSYYSGIPLYLYGIPLPVLALSSKWGLYALIPVKFISCSAAWLKTSSSFTSPLSKSQMSSFQTNPWGLLSSPISIQERLDCLLQYPDLTCLWVLMLVCHSSKPST